MLSNFSKEVIDGKIAYTLNQISSGRATKTEITNGVNELVRLYEQKYGPRATWDRALEESVRGIEVNIINNFANKGLDNGY